MHHMIHLKNEIGQHQICHCLCHLLQGVFNVLSSRNFNCQSLIFFQLSNYMLDNFFNFLGFTSKFLIQSLRSEGRPYVKILESKWRLFRIEYFNMLKLLPSRGKHISVIHTYSFLLRNLTRLQAMYVSVQIPEFSCNVVFERNRLKNTFTLKNPSIHRNVWYTLFQKIKTDF